MASEKKCSFCIPPPVLTEVAEGLAKSEFEVYLVHDHQKLRKSLASHGESLLFANIDKAVEGTRWESYVGEILEDADCAKVGVGVMTLNDATPAIREKYLMDLRVPCGFVVLKLGTAKTVEILSKTLEANEARGKRRFVRATCPPGTGLCNVEVDARIIHGDILDISSAGMAVVFQGGVELRVGTVLEKVSVLVKGVRLLVDAFVATQRMGENGSLVTIVMFLPKSLDEERLNKLRILVYRLNQGAMDQVFSSMN